MNYKDYQQARDATWRILIDCQVHELPVSLNAICKHLGVRVFSYEDASQMIEKRGLSEVITQTDGLSFYNKGIPIILFDQSLSLSRNRFTIGHELGHIILGHVKPGQATTRNREPSPVMTRSKRRQISFQCACWLRLVCYGDLTYIPRRKFPKPAASRLHRQDFVLSEWRFYIKEGSSSRRHWNASFMSSSRIL